MKGEAISVPGLHGTHCAGIIASTDATYRGVAPGVQLLNVKALLSDGRATQQAITTGIDAALDRDADVLSMSFGFNHLPTWSADGAGWTCPKDGAICTLCQAADNASRLEKRVVVVAAGNWHNHAEALRRDNRGASFDTELSCPGQWERVITVGAITKQNFEMAAFSSRGPSAFGKAKPDLCAAGVNVTSTVPRPRNGDGTPVGDPARDRLFARLSGTSMATPVVAAAAALLIGRRQREGLSWTHADIKEELTTTGVVELAFGPNVSGAGRLSLAW